MATAALEILSSGQYTIHSHKETDEFGETTSDGMNNMILWMCALMAQLSHEWGVIERRLWWFCEWSGGKISNVFDVLQKYLKWQPLAEY